MGETLLYIVGQLGQGGSERQLYYLLRELRPKPFNLAVCVWNHSENDFYARLIEDLGVPLHSFPATSVSASKTSRLRALVERLRPKLIHSYSFFSNFPTYCSSLGTGAVVFGSVRSDFHYETKRMSWLQSRLNALWPRNQIYNSYSAERNATRILGSLAPARRFVIPNGIDLHAFRSRPVPDQRRKVILGVGSLLPVKRWDRLLSAARALRETGLDFVIRVAGDGFMRPELERMSAQLGVTEHVEFLGAVADVSALMAEAHFLVHTADSEGCPNSIIEAAASGRTVVATRVGDVPVIVEDGRTGFIVAPDDEKFLVSQITNLILNPSLCRVMGEAARRKIEREFGLDKLVSQTLEAYRQAGAGLD